MPRKKTATAASGPKQGDVVRLLNDGYDVFSNKVMSYIVENGGDYNLTREQMLEIQKAISEAKTDVKNSVTDRLLSLY